MDKDICDCTIPELAPYIRGEKYTGEYAGAIINADAITTFCDLLGSSMTASVTLESCEHYKDFYTIEADFRHYILPADRANCFYAAKNGNYSRQIPPFCQYMIKKAWEQYKIPNLILKVIPAPVLEEFFQKGYLTGGITMHDVICNVACEEYNEFTQTRLRNNFGSCTELYIEETDMVAVVPKSIGQALDDDTLRRVTPTEYGLAVNGLLLRTMCGYTGAINSTYDLRALI